MVSLIVGPVSRHLVLTCFPVDFQQLAEACRPVRKVDEKGNVSWVPSETFQQLKKLKGVRFTVTHRGNKDNANKKEYKVKSIYFDPTFEGQGVNARNYYFDRKNDDGTTQRINLYDYYLQVHRVRIQYPLLPLVETGNAGLFPLEFCKVDRFNPYPYKLDADQTSAMITFSQARPQALKHELAEAVQNLDWQKDRYLAHFGVKIDTQMPTVQAKLLPNPVVQYGNTTKDPKTAGRWDLRGIKFLSPNKEEIKRWAIVIFDPFVDKAAAQNFGNQFKSVYINHGGKISGNPLIFTGDPKNPDGPVEKSYFAMLNTWKAFPQIVFYILPQKKPQPYDAIKKQVECRFGFMSQMVLGKHVKKCSPQYLSNVCLKVNAKLGGQNARIALKQPFFSVPTMMIGVDISHGATALNQVSTAAMCVSMDKDATIYTTSIQTNGWRVEIVQPFNMHDMLGPRILEWQKLNRCLPQHVFYMRDGVSEGQYAQVLDYEVKEIRRIFKEFFKHTPKITVVVATKRHHIRIFPERGDKNGNCLPGTLVEREVVHPFHYEFYLCSHVALQGTARPVRYNVIYDECGLPPDTLQRIIYEQSYQFCRSTTPVSLHPAVYYAHLAGARARQHEPRDPNATQKAPDGWVYLTRPKTGFLAKSEATRTSRPKDAIPAKLLKFATYQQVPEYKALAKVNEERMWWV
jgi:eukaryotic translation initiation factor 2C